jgi:hypothetical protein
LGNEIADLRNDLIRLQMRIDLIQRENAETNYDRWREARKHSDQIKHIALKLALNDIVNGYPEEN